MPFFDPFPDESPDKSSPASTSSSPTSSSRAPISSSSKWPSEIPGLRESLYQRGYCYDPEEYPGLTLPSCPANALWLIEDLCSQRNGERFNASTIQRLFEAAFKDLNKIRSYSMSPENGQAAMNSALRKSFALQMGAILLGMGGFVSFSELAYSPPLWAQTSFISFLVAGVVSSMVLNLDHLKHRIAKFSIARHIGSGELYSYRALKASEGALEGLASSRKVRCQASEEERQKARDMLEQRRLDMDHAIHRTLPIMLDDSNKIFMALLRLDLLLREESIRLEKSPSGYDSEITHADIQSLAVRTINTVMKALRKMHEEERLSHVASSPLIRIKRFFRKIA